MISALQCMIESAALHSSTGETEEGPNLQVTIQLSESDAISRFSPVVQFLEQALCPLQEQTSQY